MSEEFSKEDVYRLAASAEQLSEHPLGKAIAADFRKAGKDSVAPAEAFWMIPERGVCAQVEGKAVLAGNPELLREQGVPMTVPNPEAEETLRQGCTVIYVAVDGALAGYLALSDTLRQEARHD